MSLVDQKYVSFTTYRANGDAVSTPVWVVDAGDGRIGFGTSSKSGKAKRIRRNPRVALQPSDSRGSALAGSDRVEGTAEIVTGELHETIRAKVKDKYGLMVPITKFIGTVAGIVRRDPKPYADVALVVTLDGTTPATDR